MIARLCFVIAAVSCLAACSRAEKSAKVVVSATASAVASVPAPAKAVEQVRAADVQALVEAWRSAQNRGDYASYAALYDASFSGVKRVGDKSFRFDRQGWLDDRRAMFERDMTVVVKDARVFTGQRSAFAVFVQEWSTPRFADVGQKRLEVAVRDGKLLITREEMLESRTKAPLALRAPPAEELALLVPLPQGYGAVLQSGMLGTGKVRRVASTNEFQHRVERDATAAELRPYQHLKGRSMDLYRSGAVSCTGRVKSFVGLAGVFGSDEVGTDTSAQGKADAIWEFAAAARYLVAVIEPDSPKCDAGWARASDLPKPTVLEARALSEPEAAKGVVSLQQTRVGRDVQASFERYKKEVASSAKATRWSEWPSQQRSATLFTDPTTQASYATVELSVGEGCADFGGYALGFFKVTPQGWLDVTGDGDPRFSLPLRPIYGIAPQIAVVTRPGESPWLLGLDAPVLYGQGAGGYAPVLAVGELRTMCGC